MVFYFYKATFLFCTPTEGQKIAKTLSLQISKETKTLKALLQEFNACQTVTTGNSSTLKMGDVLDSSILSQKLQLNLHGYTSDKQEIINAYLLMTRSGEELEMLQVEMINVIQYYKDRASAIHNTMDSTVYDQGARALLYNLYQDSLRRLKEYRQLFATPQLSPRETNDSNSTTSQSDSEDTELDTDDDDDVLL